MEWHVTTELCTALCYKVSACHPALETASQWHVCNERTPCLIRLVFTDIDHTQANKYIEYGCQTTSRLSLSGDSIVLTFNLVARELEPHGHTVVLL